MADQFGELDLFLAAAKDCGIVFLLNQSQQANDNKAAVCVLVSQPISGYVDHICWHVPVDITCGG